MLKKLFCFLFILFLVLSINEHTITSMDKDFNSQVQQAFENSDAEFLNSKVIIVMKSNVLVSKIKSLFNINMSEIKYTNISIIHKETGKLVKLNIKEEEYVDTIEVNFDNINEALKFRRQLLVEFEQNKFIADFILMIKGKYDYKINQSNMQKITENILGDLDCQFVEGGYVNNHLLSISAYTSKCSEFITTGGHKINLNVAVKYNIVEKRTELIIATPLIYGDY
ncbi:MAG: YwmB family TATA-box binding protein [Eubacteriaceae bacterium]